MCGLVGYLTDIPKQYEFFRKNYLAEALYIDTLRGEDSTGILLVTSKGKSKLYKKAIAGHDFITSEAFKRTLKDTKEIKVAIGHNRKATMGGKEDYHAHPYKVGNIILAHNGTLTKGTFADFPGKEDAQLINIDSYRIACSINQIGAKETLEKLEGAYALTWYDLKRKTFNIARNTDRPLFIGTCNLKQEMVWASEEWMLQNIAKRNKIYITGTNHVPAGKIYTYNIEDKECIKTKEETSFKIKQSTYSYHFNRGKWENHYKKPTQTEYIETLGYKKGALIMIEHVSEDPHKKQHNFKFCRENEEIQRICPNAKINIVTNKPFTAPISSHVRLLAKCNYAYRYLDTHNKPQIFIVVGIERAATESDEKLWFTRAGTTHDGQPIWENQYLVFVSDENKNKKYYINKSLVNKEVFEKKVADGCLWCSDPIDSGVENGENLVWTTDNKPICAGCTEQLDDNFIRDMYSG